MTAPRLPARLRTAPRLLLAGGSHADIPQILAAQALGFYVITSGNRAEDLGHRHADEVCLADFSDRTAMLELAQQKQVQAICASCNDFSALSVAYVAERLRLPGHDPYEVALTLHHKDRWRAFMRAQGWRMPQTEGFDCEQTALDWVQSGAARLPLLVKPVDLTGGKGIARIDAARQAPAAIAAAFAISRAKRVIIEEFIAGSRHGLSVFLVKGRVVFHFHDNEHYHLSPYLVAAASAPGTTPPQALSELLGMAEQCARALALADGIFHMQYILRDGQPWLIEICRRAPGDLYTRFVQHATGLDYPRAIVSAEAGRALDWVQQRGVRACMARHCLMAAQSGSVTGVQIAPELQGNVFDQMLWWRSSEIVTDAATYKAGIVFLRFSGPAEMEEKMGRIQSLARVTVTD